jgi:hypothetical protein
MRGIPENMKKFIEEMDVLAKKHGFGEMVGKAKNRALNDVFGSRDPLDNAKVVLKSYPVTKAELKLNKEAGDLLDTARENSDKAKLLLDKFWTDLKLRLDIQGNDLHFNKKTKEVELLKR